MTRAIHKRLLAAALLACCSASAAAQTHMDMPEGSREVFLSLAGVWSPKRIGSREHVVGVVPLVSAQWANGVFIDLNTLGMHWSRQSNLDYGPLLAPTRAWAGATGANGGQSSSRLALQAGGFLNYRIGNGVGVGARLLYGGGDQHQGLNAMARAHWWTDLAPHHAVGIETDITLANRAALLPDFGSPGYALHGGARDAALTLHWRWELNHSTTFRALLRQDRLLGSAGASPRLEQRSGTSVVTLVTWQY
ncbi:MAG TPA: MipA/OmpV family protein [Telluria sp.]|jgi:hypothetical protein